MKRSSARARAATAPAAEIAVRRLLDRCHAAAIAGRYGRAEAYARAAMRRARALPASSAVHWMAEGALGTALRVLARHAEASFHLRNAVRLARSVGPLALAAANNALCMLYKYTGRWPEAARLYRDALAILEAAFGPRDVHLAPVLHNLGGLAHARGRFAQGIVHARRGLAIRERALGRDDVRVAMDAGALGALLLGQGKHAQAERQCRRALAIFERVHRPGHVEIAVVCNNLGAIADARDRSDEARTFYRRALRIKLRVLGPAHPDVAITWNNLAVVADKLGRPAAARVLYARALSALERAYGPRHRLTRQCRANLARL
jgi:tetratricopeptide (TPR) repeat protein